MIMFFQYAAIFQKRDRGELHFGLRVGVNWSPSMTGDIGQIGDFCLGREPQVIIAKDAWRMIGSDLNHYLQPFLCFIL